MTLKVELVYGASLTRRRYVQEVDNFWKVFEENYTTRRILISVVRMLLRYQFMSEKVEVSPKRCYLEGSGIDKYERDAN